MLQTLKEEGKQIISSIVSLDSKFRSFITLIVCLQTCRPSHQLLLLKAGMVLVLSCYFKRRCIISNEFLTNKYYINNILLALALFLDELTP